MYIGVCASVWDGVLYMCICMEEAVSVFSLKTSVNLLLRAVGINMADFRWWLKAAGETRDVCCALAITLQALLVWVRQGDTHTPVRGCVCPSVCTQWESCSPVICGHQDIIVVAFSFDFICKTQLCCPVFLTKLLNGTGNILTRLRKNRLYNVVIYCITRKLCYIMIDIVIQICNDFGPTLKLNVDYDQCSKYPLNFDWWIQ